MRSGYFLGIFEGHADPAVAIVRDGANVRVDLDKMYEADKDTAEWTGAVVKV